MSNERFFRLFSVAVLGAIALAFIPETGANSAFETAETSMNDPNLSIDLELASVEEVHQINAGHMSKFTLPTGGDGDATEVSALQELEALSRAQ